MIAKLGQYIEQIRGVSYKPSDLYKELNEDSITLLRANNIQDDGLDFNNVVYVDRKCVNPNQVIKKGDILICASSGSKNLVGKASQAKEDLDMTFGAFCKLVRTNQILPEYLGHFFRSPYYRERIANASAGVNINNIRNEHIDELKIQIPLVKEQKRIATVLDILSHLISTRRQQLAKLDELVKSRFIEMFGDPLLNPMEFKVHNLSEYIEFQTSGSRGWAKYYSNCGELFITIKNVKNCSVAVDEVQHIKAPVNAEALRTKVQEGDLLISITADLGRTGVVSKEIADYGAYINQHLICVRLNKLLLIPLYVAYFMESPAGKTQFETKNQSAVKAGLNFKSIDSFKVIVPPLLLQKEFVNFIEHIDKSKFAIQKSLEKLEILQKSLMQEYFG